MSANTDHVGNTLLAELANVGVDFLEAVSTEVEFEPGEILFEQDAEAELFYVILAGRVGLELTAPGRTPIVIQTLGGGDLVGLSWLFPPHRWSWRARAMGETKAVAFDAATVRARTRGDEELGHHLTTLVAREAIRRLHATRLQLLDLYRPVE